MMVVTNLGKQGAEGQVGPAGPAGPAFGGIISAAGVLEASTAGIKSVTHVGVGEYEIEFAEAAPHFWSVTATPCDIRNEPVEPFATRVSNKSTTKTLVTVLQLNGAAKLDSKFNFIASPV